MTMTTHSTVIRIVLGLFAGLFVWAATLQFNDATAALWVSIYGVAALFCASGAAGLDWSPLPSGLAALAALLYASWLGWCLYTGDVTPMYGDAPPESVAWVDLEEGREMGGLVFIAAALALHAGWRYHERNASENVHTS